MKAAAECVATLGYNRFTISAVARRADLSVGAMQYHFASKDELVRATLEHILDEQLKFQHRSARRPGERISRALHRRRIEALWNYLKAPNYVGFAEIAMAARTDKKLAQMVRTEHAKYIEKMWSTTLEDFPEWRADAKVFQFVANLVSTVLEGMALRQMFGQSSENDDVEIRDHLIKTVGDIFDQISTKNSSD